MRNVTLQFEDDFESWRVGAKAAFMDGLSPNDIHFSAGDKQPSIFSILEEPSSHPSPSRNPPRVTSAFLSLAKSAICHSDSQRFVLLYKLLVRFQNEKNLLRLATDKDVYRANVLAKEVRRDVHKMKAFVRFRKVAEADDGTEEFVAWFEPSHHIVRLATPFFTRRFSNMRWSILTPETCAHWDGATAYFTKGVPKSQAPDSDALEDYWRSYYASIFNPARLKINAMTSEMPKKYWKNLPEADLIPALVHKSRDLENDMLERAGTVPRPAMMAHREISKDSVLPRRDQIVSLEQLHQAVEGCRACPLWQPATQAVCGSGSSTAQIMLVGEQPGDKEDLAGKPFVGPAGQLLQQLLDEAGIDDPYCTNAVKHFKYQPRGKIRLHKNPTNSEIDHCKWWLMKEIELIRPKIIVALGASATRAITGHSQKIASIRGKVQELPVGVKLMTTFHPSYVLRTRSEEQKRDILQSMLQDLTAAKQVCHSAAVSSLS